LGEDRAVVIVMGSFRIPVENLARARPLMARVIAATRAEPGCVSYSYAEDMVDAGLIRVSEEWTDEAAVKSHAQSAHMAQWVAERTPLGLSERNIKLYSANEGRAL
jgi:quinol monooxygenase YgiN